MARDARLEEIVRSTLDNLPGLIEKALFGGWAFLLYGNLLCGVRRGSVMLRVGLDNEVWVLLLPGVEQVVMRGRRMRGYVRVVAEVFDDQDVRQRLMDAAVAFTRSLPKK
jgi:hypothetical protein